MAEDLIVKLRNKTLAGIASEARRAELGCSLKDLQTDSGSNYAIFKRGGATPATGLTILPSPAVPPAGATKVCDGTLLQAGVAIGVTAFRLP